MGADRVDTTAWGGALAAVVVFAALLASFPEKLWHWDEFQLSYGVTHFDLARHEPHPPGYYLFVLLGRALAPVVGDPARALRCVFAEDRPAPRGKGGGPAGARVRRASAPDTRSRHRPRDAR